MTEKLFVVSDVHGHCTPLLQALADAGFDANNKQHTFVSLGDLFDRGRENAAVFAFVKGLQRKILIRGNHEDMLLDALQRGFIDGTNVYNGTDVTLDELLGAGAVDQDGRFDTAAHADKISEITSFVSGMRDYYEYGSYVLTHGWLPITFGSGRYPTVDPAWREASEQSWQEARLLGWHELYDVRALLSDRVIVCGHRATYLAHLFDPDRALDCSDIFYGQGVIAIDAGTVRTGRVNVLVIESK